ncbi:exonuclease SbcCD subunit D [Donghicola mangrovi]|uniref:Nuclease SbcCD subunit D n=1 Tax=Donghicola mangrovi TaxID=2729614 RepID=A0A850Q5B4_9RHOB|nr:exonuclease SbcCD subunit D [Donghicola mangrovi]NVO24306.1 exonuclease SbcCD subunit D [Donghicola mangrovi]
MKILHTADWHLGQTLNGWSREAEHALWFEHLRDVLVEEKVDAMIVAGDIYDGINPSGDTQRLLYQSLRSIKSACPALRIVMTSGNHDPVARLEAPAAILEELDVHVIATVRRKNGKVDGAAHMIPLLDSTGQVRAYACAIPFLRSADLPGLSFDETHDGSPIVEAARRFHADLAAQAVKIASGLPIIAVGHLHCHGATESDGVERRILIGGEHAIPEDVFPQAFDYVALGHLHRPQNLDHGRIRYSGSPFPLSASEAGYEHGVTILEVMPEGLDIRHRPLPRPAEMLRFPAVGAMEIEKFTAVIKDFTVPEDLPSSLYPLVYVEIEATGPAAPLMEQAQKLLASAPVRTAGIRILRAVETVDAPAPMLTLSETDPEALFRSSFETVNGTSPSIEHIAAFREAMTGEDP